MIVVKKIGLYSFLGTSLLFIAISVKAQDLEPRSLSSAPVKSNFLIVRYAYAQGNILLDAALPIENLESRVNTLVMGYVRSINFFGLSAKYNIILPIARGDYNGLYLGEETSVLRDGMGDLRLGFSFNFLGATAYNMKDYPLSESNTVSGLSFQLLLPTGQYDKTKLINLGSNRWALKTQLGVSHRINSWFLEAYGSVRLFTNNPSFFNSGRLSQKPIFALKTHVIKTFKKGIWIELGAGYGHGGQVSVNDEPRKVKMSTMRLGATFAYSVTINHSFKLSLMSGRRWEQGPDFDGCALTYQYRWINNKIE